MSRRTEIEVGITVLVALGVLLVGVTWLKELRFQRSVKIWHVYFPQSGGLAEGDEVQVNGMKKGSVHKLHLTGDGVILDLALDTDVHPTRDSRILVRNIGLMGEKVVAVDLHSTGALWSLNDTIPGIYERGLPEVMGDVAGTVETVSRLTGRLASLFDTTGTHGDLTGTLRNLNEASVDLRVLIKETRGSLPSTLDDFSAAAKTTRHLTADREAQLGKALDNFASATEKLDRLSGRLDSLRAVVNSVADKVDRGDGTLGKMVNDRKLYNNASATIDSLQALITDIKKHPKRYLTVKIF